jgi:antitoxin VapB
MIKRRETELKRESGRIPLAERLAAIARDLKARTSKDGRPVNKDEIDELWGHP